MQTHHQFHTYSGSDMVASIYIPGEEPQIFGELSSISYSIYRSKYPVLSLGRITPKGFTRGIRTISGMLSFTDFNESIVLKTMKRLKDMGYHILMDEMPMFNVTITMANEFGSTSKTTLYGITTFTEGKSMSVNDLMQQTVYEFYALDISPMEVVKERKYN